MIAGACDNPDCATERQMLDCLQRDHADLVNKHNAALDNRDFWQKTANERSAELCRLMEENEKLKRQFEELAAVAKRAIALAEWFLATEDQANGIPGINT